ncbi:OmpA/MotB family protein [Nocardioides nematodiphilus]|uniref:OmpA/MotB family protein n=1 Tax=Nocardioides nematodiphilus TaxID=2849669 RepID=UPI001CD95624|nr:flagellar motor protein MotB [Nocardioides nematodiphilus]MCA1984277.1 flagellar motor protein MotB [Nocardioides nematodiphilus]
MSASKGSAVAPARRRKRQEEEEEHENHERWMISYADMVTLLLVLFIVLYALSQIDISKYSQFKSGLVSGFGRADHILSGDSPMSDRTGGSSGGSEMVNPQMISNLPADQAALVKNAVAEANMQAKQRAYSDAEGQVKSLLQLWKQMQSALSKKGLAGDVRAAIDERGLVVSLVSRHVVFEPNVATLTPRGQLILDTIAPVIASISEPIDVDGHTNQVKVKPKYYPTDWELSSARAVTALRRLSEHDGIPDRRLRATGFGHTKPLENPAIKGSQQINKRVDIVVLSQAPAESRALYQQAYAQLTKTEHTTGDKP